MEDFEDFIELISTAPLRSYSEFTAEEQDLVQDTLLYGGDAGPSDAQRELYSTWFLAIPEDLLDDIAALNQNQMTLVPVRPLLDDSAVTSMGLLTDCDPPGGTYRHFETFLKGLHFREVSESDWPPPEE